MGMMHFIHNQVLGNFISVTPAELFENYKYAWRSEEKRPQPVIVETQYAWTARYQGYQQSQWIYGNL